MTELSLFDDVPRSINGIAKEARLSPATVEKALRELSFITKSITRLGGVFELGGYVFGHDHQEAWVRADTLAATHPESADAQLGWDRALPWEQVSDDPDLFALEDLTTTLADRCRLSMRSAASIVVYLDEEVRRLAHRGIEIEPPRRWIAPEKDVEREIFARPAVLRPWGFRVTKLESQVRLRGAGVADLVGRTPNGGWLVVELKREGVGGEVVDQICRYLDAVQRDMAASGEEVAGLVIADGDSSEYLDAAGGDARVSFLRLRVLDLALCRPQRFVAYTADSDITRPTHAFAMAADGRTVIDAWPRAQGLRGRRIRPSQLAEKRGWKIRPLPLSVRGNPLVDPK